MRRKDNFRPLGPIGYDMRTVAQVLRKMGLRVCRSIQILPGWKHIENPVERSLQFHLDWYSVLPLVVDLEDDWLVVVVDEA